MDNGQVEDNKFPLLTHCEPLLNQVMLLLAAGLCQEAMVGNTALLGLIPGEAEVVASTATHCGVVAALLVVAIGIAFWVRRVTAPVRIATTSTIRETAGICLVLVGKQCDDHPTNMQYYVSP